MARQARLLPAGYPVHVVHRGVHRVRCFDTDTDYLRYLQLLASHIRESTCALHAYVLMSNHVHLLLTPDDTRGVSLLMKNIAQRYARYVNRSRNRTGPLWEGRFKSSVITDDAYLLACHRYIELDPGRAQLITHPREYAWSSYRANAERAPSSLVRHHPLYIELAAHDGACADAYRKLFENEIDRDRSREIHDALQRGLPLGRPEYRIRFAARWQAEASKRGASSPTGVRPQP